MLPTLGNVELGVNDFIKSAPQGFGDAQNSVIWAMQWWNDKLYVGTNRSWMCWSFASISPPFLVRRLSVARFPRHTVSSYFWGHRLHYPTLFVSRLTVSFLSLAACSPKTGGRISG